MKKLLFILSALLLPACTTLPVTAEVCSTDLGIGPAYEKIGEFTKEFREAGYTKCEFSSAEGHSQCKSGTMLRMFCSYEGMEVD